MRSYLFLCGLFTAATAHAADPVKVILAENQSARLPIVLPEKASDSLKKSAQTLADYLHKISGARFTIKTGTGETGIVLGKDADWNFPPFGVATDPTNAERYLLRSHARGLYLIGATDLAVQHAVWDLLHRLGYRQFFPGATWEVVPKLDKIEVAIDVQEQPAYWARVIWYGYGTWDYNAEAYAQWCARNRAVRGIDLHTGHAYDGILRRNAAEFKKHPEYLGLWQNERKSSHFCISNPELRKLVVADSLRQLQENPALQSLSLEPSDGSSWCECEKCRALGSISNRAVLLANQVAEALKDKFPDRYIGMYAYNQHSPPPTIQVHPKVVISVATGFIKGGYTVEQLLTGWQKQGATLGIREYYSVHTWDRDLPGAARGSNLAYIQKTIPEYHRLGARFYNAESSDNWGPNGLGYYLAARILWDLKEAGRADAIITDFLDKAFPGVQEPMRKFYQLLDGTNKPLLCDDLIGRLYRHLDEARSKTRDPQVLTRLRDLTLYVHYVELFADYSSASGAERQAAFEKLIRHGYRMRKSMLIHAKALYRDLAQRDKTVTIPTEAAWGVPESKNPWKSSAAFTDAEWQELITRGIQQRKLLDFQPVSFSSKLVPATPLKFPEVKEGSLGLYFRGTNTFWTWLADERTIAFQASAGRIYTNQGNAKLALFPAAEPEGKAVASAEVLPDQMNHAIALKSTYPGLQRLEASGGGGFTLTFPKQLPVTVQSSPEHPFRFYGRWSLYFYVPKETKIVGGFASGPGIMRDGSGKAIHTFSAKPGYFSVKVPSGEDGKLWQFENTAGQRLLMTVPPYLARRGQELLLPEEVIQKDKR